MSNLKQVLESVTAGLVVDKDRVGSLLEQYGLYGAARVLGYDISHYHYLLVAGRLTVEHMRQVAPSSLLEYARVMKELLSNATYSFLLTHHAPLQKVLDETKSRDYDHDWFSANTIYTTYAAAPQFGAEKAETPQYIWLRVAIEFYHEHGVEKVLECYHDLSIGYYTPASPTIFNAGMVENQMASCFLLTVGDDLQSILKDGIYRAGMISRRSGGLGIDVSSIRHSEIKNAGWSSGIVPMLNLFNGLVHYVDQCFESRTIVYTQDGPKKIKDIISGEQVITQDGSLGEVAYLMPHQYQGQVVEIKTTDSFRPVKVALTHPFLVKRGETEWVDAQRLRAGDLVCFPVPSYQRDVAELNVEDLYFYGLMLGAGRVDCSSHMAEIVLSTTSKEHLVRFTCDYLTRRVIEFTKQPRAGNVSITWTESKTYRFTYPTLYSVGADGTAEKSIHSYYLHLPRDKTLALMSGLLEVIGSYGPICTFAFPNEQLAEQIRYLLLRLGYSITCSYHDNQSWYRCPPSFVIKFPSTYELGKHFEDLSLSPSPPVTTMLWSRVESVTKPQPYQGRIYDLEMKRVSNYLTEVGLVHNGGRRKGAATIFLRTHHIDLEDFIQLPCKVGDKYSRAHDLNVCLWTSNLFWKRIRDDGDWTMFCPAKTPQLNDVCGEQFEKLYLAAEVDPTIDKRCRKTVKARPLYEKILKVMKETGMPYLMNGDAANIKSNHRHLGYIKSSNLCLEVVEYTDSKTVAVCNLHSLSLRMFAKGPYQGSLTDCIDFELLAKMTQRVVVNLNQVIDHNWYPLDKRDSEGNLTKAKIINLSNKRHRPVGMGVSGFAELLHILDLPFQDSKVNQINKAIFACIYWNALAQSVQLSLKDGCYESFPGSPTSEGKLQFDLWREEFNQLGPNAARCYEDDEPVDPSVWKQASVPLYWGGQIVDTIEPTWDDLKRVIKQHGLRNSLLVALMPTASTAQIRRNCESVEAHQNNLYSRKVLKCSYPVLNRHLVDDLDKIGAWNKYTVEYLQIKNGSIQGYTSYLTSHKELFPGFTGNTERLQFLELKYKTMWEIPQKTFMKLAAERSRYIDQSSSTNIYMKDCDHQKLQACHFYAQMLGLKTIMYYLRQSGGETIKFTADPTLMKEIKGLEVESVQGEENTVPPLPADPLMNELQGGVVEKRGKIICTDEICLSCT